MGKSDSLTEPYGVVNLLRQCIIQLIAQHHLFCEGNSPPLSGRQPVRSSQTPTADTHQLPDKHIIPVDEGSLDPDTT